MKYLLSALLFFLVLSNFSYSQEIKWQAGLFSFFDNTEFAGSSYQIPQTMSGVHFIPEVGLRWDTIHNIHLGFDAMHEFGSEESVDYFYPTAYYQLDGKSFRFMMGAFPRRSTIDNYPRLFFQDSIYYYRPNVNGLFWEYRKKQGYANVWLDWTGRQSETVREAFFIGFSGRYNHGILYAQHFGYMFHFSTVMDAPVYQKLNDNWLFLTSLGVDLAGKTIFNRLDVNAGWAIGLERERRGQSDFIVQNGLLMEATIEYKVFGLFNSFYTGQGQMHYYKQHSNELYWGDPIYRATTYNRSDFYINFIRNKVVNAKFIYSLHFLEGNMYHEQALKVSFNLNNY
jgi:hypothetical protein